MEHTLELLAKLGTIRRTYVLPREHGKMIPNICSLVKWKFTRRALNRTSPFGFQTYFLTSPTSKIGLKTPLALSPPRLLLPPFTVPSPPTPSPGNPLVVRILNPPHRRHAIQARRQTPPAAQLPKHTVDRRRPLKLP